MDKEVTIKKLIMPEELYYWNKWKGNKLKGNVTWEIYYHWWFKTLTFNKISAVNNMYVIIMTYIQHYMCSKN